MSDADLVAALLASPTVVLVGARPDGTITRWSAGAADVYGWTAEEAVGRHLSMLLPPGAAHELDLRQRLLAGERVPPFETVRVDRHGAPVQVELDVVAERDHTGAVVGTVALHRDLRRARRAEDALDAIESEMRARFFDSPLPQARADLDGRLLALNGAAERLSGRSDATGEQAQLHFAPEDREAVEAARERLVRGLDSSARVACALLRADGERIDVALTLTVVRGTRGEVQLAGTLEDVSDLRRTQARAAEQAARFDALLETMPVAVFSYDTAGCCTSSRGSGLDLLGLGQDELVGADLFVAYADQPALVEAMRASLAGEEGSAVLEAADRVWQCHYRPLLLDGRTVGGLGVAVDVTELSAAQAEVAANEARLRSLLRHATDVALVLDTSARIVFTSPAVVRQFGYEEAALFWRSGPELNHPDDARVARSAWRSVLRHPGATARFACRVRHADGSWRWTEQVFTNLLDDPAVRGVVVNLRDVHAHRALDEQLRRLPLHDRLTGLANRGLLVDRVEQALAWGRREGTGTGLLVLDVVGTGRVNAEHGDEVGDALLCTVAARLREALPATDSVARLGSDEFAVLVEDVVSAEQLRSRAVALAAAVRGPVVVAGVALDVDVRVGTALTPAEDAVALLLAAERAVPSGRVEERVVVARAAADDSTSADAAVADLRRGIAAGELVVHYQPVVRLGGGEVAGAEALVRWQHPERGLLPPAEIVPLAESSGLIGDLGEHVLREACRQAAAWRAAGLDLAVGVNLSPRQLVGGDVVALVRDVLAETGADPRRLVLEVTESALMDDAEAPEVLVALRGLGLRLALDDFGTGYSSLTYLKRFPVDAIKVDRSFVAGLGRDADDEAIVASVVSLARSVGKLVVAEGVETPRQLAALRALGVQQGQGYLWSPAVPADELVAWLRERGPLPPAEPAPAVVRLPVPADVGGDELRILALHDEGASLHTIAAAMNAEGRRTPAGPRWTTTTVARVVARLRAPV